MAQPAPNNSIFDGLNESQRRAVTSAADTVAILAGPGSGKTQTLTARVVWLIDHVGYHPQDIVVATFTVKAAREMKERIGKSLGDGRETKIILGTFHSIARRYLAAYGRLIGLNEKFGIADDSDSRAIIVRICKRLQLQVDPAHARAWISKKKAKGTEMPSRVVKKEPKKTPQLEELETCYREYQKHLESSNLLDYDDLLVRCAELLRKFPACVSNIQAVLVDEYQDTNGIQYDLMKLFAQQHRRITIVGDPDQSIYGWRSAEIGNLWKLLREFRATEEVSLEQNYRSSEFILNLSLQVIEQDTKRYKKSLKPVHNKGTRPVLRRLISPDAEADWIISEIRRIIMMSGSMITHNDVAILIRSAYLSRHIESSLGKAGISYRMVGGLKFYERAEIKTIIDYLRVIHQPENNDALARILNVPRRGVGDITIRGLLEEAETSGMSVWRRISQVDGPNDTPIGLVQIIEQLLSSLDFQRHLQTVHPEDHEQRWANVQEFVALAGDFVKELELKGDESLPEIEGIEQAKEVDVLPRFLANVALATDAQTGDDDQDSKPRVTISTIHAAKGLEWPVVFVPAVYDGSIPHSRSDDIDEERRLLYVAMTRAQSLLYLSYPVRPSSEANQNNEMSPFVSSISRSFAEKGPCLDRHVMKEIAKVLGRELPSDEKIFGALPPGFSTEDNLFPVDPEHVRGLQWDGQGDVFNGPRAKRPRIHGPGMGKAAEEERPWQKDYLTTMEQASKFTISNLPGFISASAHQAALVAANAAAEAKRKEERAQKLRLPQQKSIMAFVKTGSEPAPPPAALASAGQTAPAGNAFSKKSSPGFQQLVAKQPQPVIQPDLASHKLGPKKMPTRPTVGHSTNDGSKGKAYPCFSSSPPRPDSEQNGNGISEAADDDEDDGPPPQPTRAAACLHATTCTTVPKGLGSSVFRRPAGLGRDSITPIEKLKKPFKPLTINKPGRGGKM
ncbi:ATP-dependent DNA helicase srs2-like protein [Thermochaetoides thermophila DSM 1495]|uniref:DNA 3'-5' helicase n=1 Tax=Chaetomium thermophilum (strain DSM 1495 / CBS 144.50 / IMI 039719) TaxID=759272 RepID=G0SA64_CHATD|nr:ATP-dependent DNA helicase srs2-like protein [Thermochaetoides thermophila DSM 1495]EGS19636.1 ATP-dependent DNA helicase srs2-like protein [Thermochaetoides thermophila DSM 1495]